MNEEFKKKIAGYCARQGMFSAGDAVLVALSGGGDSVGLLYVLMRLKDKLGISLEAAHLNHSLRGDESDKDERFCLELCSRWNISLTVEKLAEGKIAGENGSIETVARDTRRAFLRRIGTERGMHKTATGHTLDDQVETILQRILRGTGPLGIQGILPCGENMVRPLLCATRAEVREYLDENGIEFCEDSTNSDTVFLRNRIRHELIPFLRNTFSPDITGALQRLGELSLVQESYLREQMFVAFQACCIHVDSYKILLDKLAFMGYHKALRQRMVRHCLELLEGAGRDTDMDEVENVLALIADNSGAFDVTSGIRCEAGKRIVTFVVHIERYEPIPLKLPGETVIPMSNGSILAERAGNVAGIDGKESVLVSHDVTEKYGDLTVGLTRRGEFMTPFGMKDPVKIRDILSSVSFPKLLRDAVPVIRAGAVAIWIPGLRSSELLRVSELGAQHKHGSESVILRFKDGLQWR